MQVAMYHLLGMHMRQSRSDVVSHRTHDRPRDNMERLATCKLVQIFSSQFKYNRCPKRGAKSVYEFHDVRVALAMLCEIDLPGIYRTPSALDNLDGNFVVIIILSLKHLAITALSDLLPQFVPLAEVTAIWGGHAGEGNATNRRYWGPWDRFANAPPLHTPWLRSRQGQHLLPN